MAIRESRPRSGGGAEGRRIEARLRAHKERRDELVAQGVPKDEADQQAFREIAYGAPRKG